MTDDIRLLVCGGRGYTDAEAVSARLDALKADRSIALLIEGGASGADRLARQWARDKGIQVMTVAADWEAHGKLAGPIRNQQMLDIGKPDLVIAFPGGKGTANMIAKARMAGVPVETAP